ncbi:hypothetical protein [Bacillus mojavensis]|uniref:hypothetical protein n=1 Tax=Bacillus mojavensis TaxID=72360 RepID=UPI002DBA8486|nr:hypothetical protein [Bacillus mojavensis]MEC1752240.1 hypothetical protein [Bacillus mojavensis]
MIINKIIIYDYIEKRIREFVFTPNTNIFVSRLNSVGKSSLIKSIYHCLGYSIKIWPSNWDINNMMFQVTVTNNDRKHLITRHKNLFYIDGREQILNEKEYSSWLQDFLKIHIKIKNKKTKTLSDVYASEILLPFYIDQDKSWNGYVYTKTADSFARYNNTVKNVFDFYFNVANKYMTDLEIKKSSIETEISNNQKKIEALSLLSKEQTEFSNPKNVIYVEASNEEHIDKYLSFINELNIAVAEIENKIIELDTKISEHRREIKEFNKLKKSYDKKFADIKYSCIHCNSKLTQEQSLTRLKIRNNQYEVIEQIDKGKQQIKMYEKEREQVISEKNKVLDKIKETERELRETNEYTKIDAYINDRVNQEITNNYITVEQKLVNEIYQKDMNIRELNRVISTERKIGNKKKSEIRKKYQELLNEYERYFHDIKLDDIKFYSFKEISGSGVAANKKMLALYTLYSNLVSDFSVVQAPFAMDSFIKNETAEELKKQMFDFLSKHYLSLNGQIFFSIIKENVKYLDKNEEYNFINLEKPILEEVSTPNKDLVKYFEIIDKH